MLNSDSVYYLVPFFVVREMPRHDIIAFWEVCIKCIPYNSKKPTLISPFLVGFAQWRIPRHNISELLNKRAPYYG